MLLIELLDDRIKIVQLCLYGIEQHMIYWKLSYAIYEVKGEKDNYSK